MLKYRHLRAAIEYGKRLRAASYSQSEVLSSCGRIGQRSNAGDVERPRADVDRVTLTVDVAVVSAV